MKRIALIMLLVLIAGTVFAQATRLTAGTAVQGTLQRGDTRLRSGEYYDTYTYTSRGNESVTIDCVSTEFDTYLMLTGPGSLDEQNDDGPNGTNAQIVYTITAAGEYEIVATSYASGETGRYTLTLTSTAAGRTTTTTTTTPTTTTTTPTATATATATGNTRTENGRLERTDRRRTNGAYQDTIQVDARVGDRFTVDLVSSDFDPYLMVTVPGSSTQLTDDDGGDGLNSRLTFTVTQAGRVELVATSYSSGETGAYTLTYTVGGATTTTATTTATTTTPTTTTTTTTTAATTSQPVNTSGELRQGDQTLDSGEFVDYVNFTGRRGDNINIELNSEDFDCYLILFMPDGSQTDNDDRADGQGLNSQILYTLPADGSYRIAATSYAAGDTGRYTLTARVTGNFLQSTYYGVFAGLADYPDSPDNLPYCDADATNIAQALVRNGAMRAENQAILLNSQATGANFRAAVQRFAARMTESDTLVVFYSGHGGRERRSGSTEADGQDETIVLFADDVFDDDLATMFAAVRGRIIFVSDSCYAGGLDDALAARSSGWMGFFASQEFHLSDTFSSHDAGGYLSYFFKEAIPAADLDGNGFITLAEMRFYLNAQWYGGEGPAVEDNQILTISTGYTPNETPMFILTPGASGGSTGTVPGTGGGK